MSNGGRFQFAGFDRDGDKAPSWLPDDAFEELDDAVEAATTRVGSGSSARVDVIQIDGRTGYVVRAVTEAGVKTVSNVVGDLDDIDKSLSAASRSSVVVGVATVTRSMATTTIASAMTLEDATRSLERTFGTMLWNDNDVPQSHGRTFEHSSVQVESFRGVNAFIGVNCRGSFKSTDGASTVRLRFRPTRGAIATGSMYFAFTLLCTLVASIPSKPGVSPNRWLYAGTALFGAGAWWILKIVRKHRRQIDAAFVDALDGIDPKPVRSRGRRRS